MCFDQQRRPFDSGFTLVEVCIAMMLLVLVATGVAQLFGVAMKATQGARVQTSTSVLASQKLEQLRALQWTLDVDGRPLSDRTSDVAVEPSTNDGSGLSTSPANTLDASTDGYVDYLSSRGEWVGTGATPPATARFLRRWSIQPLPEDPDNSLILQVLVTTVERDRHASMPRRRLAGDALVTAVLTRREP